MRDKIKQICNSVVFESTLLLTVCLILATSLSVKYAGGWTPLSWGLAIGASCILFAGLVWGAHVYFTEKTVKQMQPIPMLLIETCSRVLILYWLYVVSTPRAVVIWAILFIMQEYKLIKDIRDGVYQ